MWPLPLTSTPPVSCHSSDGSRLAKTSDTYTQKGFPCATLCALFVVSMLDPPTSAARYWQRTLTLQRQAGSHVLAVLPTPLGSSPVPLGPARPLPVHILACKCSPCGLRCSLCPLTANGGENKSNNEGQMSRYVVRSEGREGQDVHGAQRRIQFRILEVNSLCSRIIAAQDGQLRIQEVKQNARIRLSHAGRGRPNLTYSATAAWAVAQVVMGPGLRK